MKLLYQTIGIPDEEFGGDGNVLPGWKHQVADYFSMDSSKVCYLYDFGDGWEHEIELEDIVQQGTDISSPACIAGERACPPEDCGGVFGYQNFFKSYNWL